PMQKSAPAPRSTMQAVPSGVSSIRRVSSIAMASSAPLPRSGRLSVISRIGPFCLDRISGMGIPRVLGGRHQLAPWRAICNGAGAVAEEPDAENVAGEDRRRARRPMDDARRELRRDEDLSAAAARGRGL